MLTVVNLQMSAADAHILRAKLTQTNSPGSWEGRMIADIDRAIAAATSNGGWRQTDDAGLQYFQEEPSRA